MYKAGFDDLQKFRLLARIQKLCQFCDKNCFFCLFSFYCLYSPDLIKLNSCVISTGYLQPLELNGVQGVGGSNPLAPTIVFSIKQAA